MSHFALKLLGPIRVELDGQPLTRIQHKTAALLAYLAVESEKAHRREVLTDLFWSHASQADGLNSLRQALWSLRSAFHQESFLIAARDTVRFNPASDFELDYGQFLTMAGALLHSPSPLAWNQDVAAQALALYRGPFLADLALRDANRFDEWMLFQREKVDQLALNLLQRMAAFNGSRPALMQAYAQRILAIDPYNELAHHMVIRALAQTGQRNKALQKFENYCLMLKEDLNTGPGQEIIELYHAIQKESLAIELHPPGPSTAAAPQPPGWTSQSFPIPFIGCQSELEVLANRLDRAICGQGRCLFITGESGSGKTTLLREFTRIALNTWPNLTLLGGSCSAAREDIPYFPFREMLRAFFGGSSSESAPILQQDLQEEQRRRLKQSLPEALTSILARGGNLTGAFSLPLDILLQQANDLPAAALSALKELADRHAAARNAAARNAAARDSLLPSIRQDELFHQFAETLQAISARHPLLVIIDDLQWGSPETISLLHDLSKRISRSPILILGAFRSGEIETSDSEGRGPLMRMVNDLQRVYGERVMDLDRRDGHAFIESLLNVFPNRFSTDFRESLFHITEGHPLFTVELFEYFRENHSLGQDEKGIWVEKKPIHWHYLPARVEAVITQRIQSLPVELRELLAAASVEGEVFSVEVLARLLLSDQEKVQALLQGPLSQSYHFVSAEGLLRFNGRRLSRFRFRHILFQRYLYDSLDVVSRSNLHERVALALEEIYQWQGQPKEELDNGRTLEAAAQLAHHFEQANLPLKAAEYQLMMGNLAYNIPAFEEAIACFRRGVALLESLPDTPEYVQRKIDLYFGLGSSLGLYAGWGGADQMAAFNRAYELSRQHGTYEQLGQALRHLAVTNLGKGNFQKSLACSQNLLQLAEFHNHAAWRSQAMFLIGQAQYMLANLPAAEESFRAFLQLPPLPPEMRMAIQGIDASPAAFLWLAVARALRGDYAEAQRFRQQGLQELYASRVRYSLPFGLVQDWILLFLIRSPNDILEQVCQDLADEVNAKKIVTFYPWVWAFQGKILINQGQVTEGIRQIRRSITETQKLGSGVGYPLRLTLLAEAYLRAGDLPAGLQTVEEGLAHCERWNVDFFKSPLLRLQGELLAQSENFQAAEECLRRAVEIARTQDSQLWELQAALTWGNLLRAQGRLSEACQKVWKVYTRFQKESDFPDLKAAREFLAALGSCDS